MNTDVSVIIPVFNGEAFIGRAIDSVLRQTHPATEIIVVNDGSTDGTAQALARFGDRIRAIHTPNRGVSSARNAGFAASTCSLVAFLDADDEWHDDKLARQVDALARHPRSALCCCDYVVQDGAAPHAQHQPQAQAHFSRVATRTGTLPDDWMRDPLAALVQGNFVGTTSTVLVKRALLNTVGLFHSRYKQAEDYDLWIRCALVTEFTVMSEVLLKKIGHDGNLTNDQIETFLYHETVLDAHVAGRTFAAHPALRSAARLALAQTRYQLANLLFEARRYAESGSYYLKALRTQASPRNVGLFLHYTSRKLVRTLSFGTLRAKAA
ncbi:glycosyltransferase family 2 protein [Massilia sp. TN1-12]|uniref:glycosyltransferase family 2 protein n=1 Tax=Massilia paldalensis TaxID=3377675 RepID=UPI00384CBE7A